MNGNGRSTIAVAVGVLLLALADAGGAACVPRDLAANVPRDPVVRVLAQQDACPKDPMTFVDVLQRSGARLDPTLVNFEGFHNVDAGAYFIFESVSNGTTAQPSNVIIAAGDLLFGHFAFPTSDGRLVSNDSGLALELIAWDPDKQFYNFYELRDGTWAYKGDSKDILDDIELLHRRRNASASTFGKRLRCSGCHINGGLLQKELATPHNDWFVAERKLPLGTLKPDAFIKARVAAVVDAGELAKLVNASSRRLADSPGYRKVLAGRSMQEQLRPLFCPLELNIESDSAPVDERKPEMRIPAAFFADPRLATADISVKRQHYDAALAALHSQLPKTPGRVDADHGWLAPVKAQSDIVAVDALVEQHIVEREFAFDVLAVDMTNPVFSKTRCALLQLVPDQGGAGFFARFEAALRGASGPGATELLRNLTDPARNTAFHQREALAFLGSCQRRAGDPAAVLEWSRLLAQRRAEVAASEISQNSRNKILEDPGRVVFPSIQPAAAAGRLTLTAACQVK